MSGSVKSERIQLRVTSGMKDLISKAALIAGQDVTSFVLSSAAASARTVMLEDQLIKLSEADIARVEDALDAAEVPSPELVDLLRSVATKERSSNS